LVGISEGRRPLEIPRAAWEDNIKKTLKETDWKGAGWINVAQERDKVGR
jgi:hypothetical protein